MYGLPETHLFCEETMAAWLQRSARAPWPMADGLLRAIAQLYFGRQTEATIKQAREWLMSQIGETTESVFRLLGDRVFPLILVDKSPSTLDSLPVLRRLLDHFPDARFVHLVRHPKGFSESVLKLLEEHQRVRPLPSTHWLVRIASASSLDDVPSDEHRASAFDPQRAWYVRNQLIRTFLKSVAPDRQIVIRGEDIFVEPDGVLRSIAHWMDLRTDVPAIEAMMHPEESSFACMGPRGARYGNDGSFLLAPALRPGRKVDLCLEGPVSWRGEGQGLWPEVKALAREFGYE
jgi:hypothetical protein